MKRLRLHRMRTRFALLAIVAMFWSQLAMAAHPGCIAALAAVMQLETAAVETIVDRSCDGSDVAGPDHAICQGHCSQGGSTSEVARIPPIPPMLAVPAVPLVGVVTLSGVGRSAPDFIDRPAPVSWHRPTAHPAALLLI